MKEAEVEKCGEKLLGFLDSMQAKIITVSSCNRQLFAIFAYTGIYGITSKGNYSEIKA